MTDIVARHCVILVTGSRGWPFSRRAIALVESALLHHAPIERLSITLRHGKAKGLDTLAERIALGWRWEIDPCPADWDRHGPGAGPIRNQFMVDREPRASICIAFPMPGSVGTYDCAVRARAAHIPIRWYPGPGVSAQMIAEERDFAARRIGL